jgi:SAM-dependent methyltransferase
MSGHLMSRMLGGAKSLVRRAGLLPYAKRAYGFAMKHGGRSVLTRPLTYALRRATEQANYAEVSEVHDLPASHDYWAEKYLLPKARRLGFSSPDEFYAVELERCLARSSSKRVVSIGSGNCDTEVRVAQLLTARGRRDFVIECLDMNPDMLRRGAAAAAAAGVGAHVAPLEGDFNRWRPQGAYAAVMANHALHHVLELEHLFDAVKQAIGAEGGFITSDMIGRNGHQRWPEALEILQEFWRELPPGYRFNRQLNRQEDAYLDWDCSVSGFEGIRAQDILPLAVGRFGFELFLPFANLIDPFIDRSFGHHFDPQQAWDRDFLDRVHARDEAELLAGRIKPTHMFAVMRAAQGSRRDWLEGFRPETSVRVP